ncbi:hypothetical protein [Microvirga alba]|uniref:Uncharacterized protein n=1 Tax=Microvirga alba TaxID=2791025 RepID=A0A931BKP2_9HYPH|nr:hypothetical protein [Microvirga alba]MBF9233011.1 hypothetical protein [Microvirga alba]
MTIKGNEHVLAIQRPDFVELIRLNPDVLELAPQVPMLVEAAEKGGGRLFDAFCDEGQDLAARQILGDGAQ